MIFTVLSLFYDFLVSKASVIFYLTLVLFSYLLDFFLIVLKLFSFHKVTRLCAYYLKYILLIFFS